MFLFKNKIITVDAFTYMGAAYELFKVESAGKFTPDWWKKLQPFFKKENRFNLQIDHPTMKSCAGFTELYKNGLIIPLWSDLVLETAADGSLKYQWALDQSSDIASHDAMQMGYNFVNDYIHIKLQSPWLLQESSGVDFMWTEPTWNLLSEHNYVKVLPGVINYKHVADTNINLFLPKKAQRIELPAGLPLAHLMPISDKRIKIVHHLIDKEEFIKKSNRVGTFKFKNSYRTMLKIKENTESKCPFGFK